MRIRYLLTPTLALLCLTTCAWKTQRICYDNGLCVNIAEKSVMQEACYVSGIVDDKGLPLYQSQIRACYKRLKNEIWLQYGHTKSLAHELCHYFGMSDKECDKIHAN